MLTVYVDMMSQPARALLIFIRLNKLPVKEVVINLARGRNRQDEYLEIYKLGKIPCLKEGDWVLPESATILRYLARTFSDKIAAHWYPEESKARAKVEAAMDWHHSNTRQGCMLLIWNQVIAPANGQPYSESLIKRATFVLEQSLQALERYWLADTTFVAGDDISIADLLICTELVMLRMLDGAQDEVRDMEAWLKPYPKVRTWMFGVHDSTEPYWSEVHAIMHAAARKLKERKFHETSLSKL
ncbi:hypothetical protein WJX73_005579 [Symbiochloris irregularis]|uniref:Glutathione S-transferase n=1 Tax=Symbiochloris irregularis TaxID=706552 RepID=A0AAW1P318_9CHLO